MSVSSAVASSFSTRYTRKEARINDRKPMYHAVISSWPHTPARKHTQLYCLRYWDQTSQDTDMRLFVLTYILCMCVCVSIADHSSFERWVCVLCIVCILPTPSVYECAWHDLNKQDMSLDVDKGVRTVCAHHVKHADTLLCVYIADPSSFQVPPRRSIRSIRRICRKRRLRSDVANTFPWLRTATTGTEAIRTKISENIESTHSAQGDIQVS